MAAILSTHLSAHFQQWVEEKPPLSFPVSDPVLSVAHSDLSNPTALNSNLVHYS